MRGELIGKPIFYHPIPSFCVISFYSPNVNEGQIMGLQFIIWVVVEIRTSLHPTYV